MFLKHIFTTFHLRSEKFLIRNQSFHKNKRTFKSSKFEVFEFPRKKGKNTLKIRFEKYVSKSLFFLFKFFFSKFLAKF